jgi:hypothetical protein
MRTLDELSPSWGRTLSSTGGCSSQRFQCVLSNQAVLDKETGLVWMRTTGDPAGDWVSSRENCRKDRTGGRSGWRLPEIDEFLSLYDATTASGLPTGHPFTVTAPARYFWSGSPGDSDPTTAIVMDLGSGIPDSADPLTLIKSFPNAAQMGLWCVRGGDGADEPSFEQDSSWSRKLDSSGGCNSERFVCVLSGAAVLDRETGLVWERTPSTTFSASWGSAQGRCIDAKTGDRGGWRVPTIFEAFSLIGTSLPAGHPFILNSPINASTRFASRTSASDLSGYGYGIDANFAETSKTAAITHAVWCVRGPGSSDGG